MTRHYQDIVFTDDVKALQEQNGSRSAYSHGEGQAAEADHFTAAEAGFISARDSFYMASISKSGWPYMQHRGGPVGFVKVLDARRFAIADYRGNRQYVSIGNFQADPRVSLIFMDYTNKQRLKVLAHAEIVNLETDEALAKAIRDVDYSAKVERAIVFTLEAFDWNCPQHITERYTIGDVREVIHRFQARIADLEQQLAESKNQE